MLTLISLLEVVGGRGNSTWGEVRLVTLVVETFDKESYG